MMRTSLRSRALWSVLSSLILLLPLLALAGAGCGGKNDAPKDPNYYTGPRVKRTKGSGE